MSYIQDTNKMSHEGFDNFKWPYYVRLTSSLETPSVYAKLCDMLRNGVSIMHHIIDF